MLESMTGFGSGQATDGRVLATAEVRTVNHRGLKISSRITPSSAAVESQVEKIVKAGIRRGSVQLAVKASLAAAGDPSGATASSSLDVLQVLHYLDGARDAATRAGLPQPDRIEPFLALPNVTFSADQSLDADELAGAAAAAVTAAVAALREFRQLEGRALKTDLQSQTAAIRGGLATVTQRAPSVAAEYRNRLHERMQTALNGTGVQLTDEQIVREVALFADRADVNEEVTRLSCHLDQFDELIDADEVEGRRLDFLCQEMFREINTIGSKANDLTLSQTVVTMKAAAEKLREQVQNVE